MKKLLVSVIVIALLFCSCASADQAVVHPEEIAVIRGIHHVSVTFKGMTIPLPDENVRETGKDGEYYAERFEFISDNIAYITMYGVFMGQIPRMYSYIINNTNNFMIAENVTAEMIGQYDYIRDNYTDVWEKAYEGSDALLDFREEVIEIDGHPARLVTMVTEEKKYESRQSRGILIYNREGVSAQIVIESFEYPKDNWDELDVITMDELKEFVPYISFDRSAMDESIVTAADGEFTLAPEDGAVYLAAGNSVTLVPSYADPKKAKERNGYFKDFSGTPSVVWTITDAETGEAVKDAEITDTGKLTAGEEIAQPRRIRVQADNKAFLTSASCELTLLPKAAGISAEPAEVALYEGNAEPQKVALRIDPDCIPADAVTWKPSAKGIVEITANTDGTFSFLPVKKGETTFLVTAPGGQNMKLKAAVYAPVTDVSLTLSGKPKPGATVTVKEVFTPKSGINRKVEWTVDVGEDVAVIDRGKVKISRDAPAGTVITVTCTALGAPEPVVRTISFEVAE